MAMTNKEIVFLETQRLAEEGLLKYTGREFKAVDAAGNEVTVKEVEPCHTAGGWKTRGYKIKKGAKHNIEFSVWKYVKRKPKDMTEEEAQERGFCIMKNACWFTLDQVEPWDWSKKK